MLLLNIIFVERLLWSYVDLWLDGREFCNAGVKIDDLANLMKSKLILIIIANINE
jgi:hypothetical protein